MLKQYLEAGKVVGTQGLRGELRVQPWCDSAAFLCRFKRLYWRAGEEEILVKSARVHKNLALLKLEGVDTIEQADQLRNRILFINREDCQLAEGEYFIQDLIGMQVMDADSGCYYGRLTDVFQTGANDVYKVTDQDGKNYLLPSIPEVVIARDIQAGVMKIRPMRGIFDED